MEPKDKTPQDPFDGFIKSIQKMSDNRIELAFKNRGIENFDEVKREIITEAKEKIKKEVEELKKDFLVIFGLFASFIAFISGEISILKTIDNIFDKIGFSFLFVSFILGFLFGILFLLDSEVIENKYKKMSWIFSLFFFIGLMFILCPILINTL